MKLIKGGVQQNRRRISALLRLQNQLKSGNKNTKNGVIQLSDKDITRIKREISILEQLIG